MNWVVDKIYEFVGCCFAGGIGIGASTRWCIEKYAPDICYGFDDLGELVTHITEHVRERMETEYGVEC